MEALCALIVEMFFYPLLKDDLAEIHKNANDTNDTNVFVRSY